jgi:hypothetical protein
MQLFGRAEAFLSQGHNFERAGTGNARDLENLLFLFWFVFFLTFFFFGHASAEIISGVIGLSCLVAHFQGE